MGTGELPQKRLPARVDSPSGPGRPCSIAEALKIVGERWALLAVREIGFGNHRFDQLATNTGASRDILTARLRSLEAAGVIYRSLYNERPPRYQYHLTEAGRDLFPVLAALRDWGNRWLVEEKPTVVEHTCGHELRVVSACEHCGGRLDARGGPSVARFQAPGWTVSGPVEG
ncbi:winged helix-turn-helix transcriptional regulator [Streptomyces sp. 4F14]|uniref:winged helix-turn-helix transcriptional regulator n=1 Tax=Streptomyces sp. 4F14 TaxID=3394380 RepID=UPI003A88E53D